MFAALAPTSRRWNSIAQAGPVQVCAKVPPKSEIPAQYRGVVAVTPMSIRPDMGDVQEIT